MRPRSDVFRQVAEHRTEQLGRPLELLDSVEAHRLLEAILHCELARSLLVVVAGRVGRTRLIDNLVVDLDASVCSQTSHRVEHDRTEGGTVPCSAR